MVVTKVEVALILVVCLIAILLMAKLVSVFGWYNLGPVVYVQVVVDAAVGVGTNEV